MVIIPSIRQEERMLADFDRVCGNVGLQLNLPHLLLGLLGEPRHVTNTAFMRELESEDMGAKVDDRKLHHLRSAGDIMVIIPSIRQEERMLADFDRLHPGCALSHLDGPLDSSTTIRRPVSPLIYIPPLVMNS
ncbi:unnamed protein product [Heligmosomoides polygyrus]|uniref:DEAD domain-containing protein n=1 Tax=Heligmosomoides polygyrus TaxID=6339 RepID=A0A183FZJ1_HELPZ|nr:unnamed protein product [Heligmosomoides polygyrus]